MPEKDDLKISLTDSQKISLNIITMNTAINDIQTDVRDLIKIVITGNGELPLREQVRNNSVFISSIKYWTRFVFGALIVQTIAFTAGILIAIVKFLPVLERLATQP
jgi:hypothetical protein